MDKQKLEYKLTPQTIPDPDIPKLDSDEDGLGIASLLIDGLRLYAQKSREYEFDQMTEFAKRRRNMMTESDCKFNIGIINSVKEVEKAMEKREELVKKIVENTEYLQSLQGDVDMEKAHCEADDTLEVVLELIGIHYDIPEIKELIQAYDKVDKWYS